MPGGAPACGWTMYPPLSLQSDSLAYVVFAIHLMGISSIMGAINIIATILNMRAPGMDLMKMPVFVWSWLITAFLLIAVMPALAGAVTMLLTDKYFGTNFRSEEHTSELQSLMRISYAVFCLKKKKKKT